MITNIRITGINYEVDEQTKKYALKRTAHLDRYLPKNVRKSATIDIKLKQVNHDHGNKYEAEITMDVPGSVLTAKDSTFNIMAAIDIVVAKILSQIRDYKEANITHLGKRGVMSRFKRSFDREL